jgi:RHH-type transcriptional regulator, proline utilization regulon repressor / proline dehydrogenase / delta 1-pyrroline-5-carboxylate dehydrogenase
LGFVLCLYVRSLAHVVSVKVSAVTAQLHRWDFSGSLSRIEMNLIRVFTQAAAASPRTFVNLDMESYDDLELTIEAFTSVLGRDEFAGLDAGIVIQAYLPDALPTMQRLVAWSNERFKRAGGQIKIRLVKGANLAMERVEAEMRGWTQAPYASKAETDANWIRCLDWMLERPVRTLSVRLGVASHNLFDVAYARLVSIRRGLQDRVQFEMLQGMIQAEADVVRRTNEDGRLLLYTPIVEEKNFDTAVAYLFRRLEENSSGDNFLRSLFTMNPGSVTFQAEAAKFRASLASGSRRDLWNGPRRFQQRPAVQAVASSELQFINEPDTDPSQPQNRLWAASQLDATTFVPVSSPVLTTVEEVDAVLARSAAAVGVWRDSTVESRRSALRRIGDELARRRGDLINAMVIEGGKVLEEADAEVSEAIDFAFYYAEQARALPKAFKSFGTAVVVSPWNYPVAIACGGVFASLAAGNAVVLKPAPETPRCAEIAAECVASAGLPDSVFQFVRVPENDVGRRLICGGDCVILTGAYETAKLFQSWNPTMRLFAETSGKNCMVITPNADLDLAASDLVSSAFGHAGQKCSATSLCILVGNVGDDDRFLRQVMDATESIAVGPATNIATTMGPLISAPNERLARALTHLDEGESWLVKPTCMDEDGEKRLWTPGVKMNAGKWFQSTECFGPVLGIVVVKTLEDAIRLQNAGMFGLTAGLQSLDPFEIETWSNAVQAGNLYINRGTTGAIVRRQPFGGWKMSSFGSGAMAGGRNYVRQLGRAGDSSELNTLSNGEWLARATDSDLAAVRCLFEVGTDDAGLTCEANLHRYRLARVCVRVSPNARALDVKRVRAAFQNCGNVPVDWSDCTKETAAGYAARLGQLNVDRVRIVGAAETEVLEAATLADVYAADSPVVFDGSIELLNYLREQCVTRTMHRFGNVLAE